MGLKNIFSVICCCCLWLCGADGADLKDMWIEKDVQKREKLQDVMQSYVDKLPKKQFDAFDLDPKAQTADPVLKFYDQAIERLIKDIPATRVRSGTVVIWYLYNMGFVIKTPNVCFAIDIHHRHARKLEPDLTIIGHLQELAHEINVYRWKFSDGRIELGKFKQEKRKAYVPVWGEKFIWDGEKLMGCQK